MSSLPYVAGSDTHEVTNQSRPFEDINLFETDIALREAVRTAAGDVHDTALSDAGQWYGSERAAYLGRTANENPPKLKNFDRFGHRIDTVEFHPSYHELMTAGLEAGVSAAAWREGQAGHVLHSGLAFLASQTDSGTMCPMSMTYAAVPALRKEPDIAAEWVPQIQAGRYDERDVPASAKDGVTLGMAMTEKQGGSDVRANTTKAERTEDGDYRLNGHKWFCSAPMSDGFLTLAYADGGITCFLVPRWTRSGERNGVRIMRLKDKMGDRSNASSEIEYHQAVAQRIGEEGRGIRTIIEMVNHTRLDCVVMSAALMRASFARAVWHARNRSAFQKSLVHQPSMAGVLADIAIDSEAATAMAFRLARSFDAAEHDVAERAFSRIATPLAKYLVCKRAPSLVYEAMECHGGAGFVEEGDMPRLFRQSPLNSIWEGSGNVIALDILRAMSREPEALDAVMSTMAQARGRHPAYDVHFDRLDAMRNDGAVGERNARHLAEGFGLGLQAAVLAERESPVFEAFCIRRLEEMNRSLTYGSGRGAIDEDLLIERAFPAHT